MGNQTWKWLRSRRISCQSRKGARKLFAYGSSEPLPTLGTFTAKVRVEEYNQQCVADFVVVDGNGRTLLSKETAETLELLRVGPGHVNEISDGVVEKYKRLFEGVGRLKGYELNLNTDKSVRPVAQLMRRMAHMGYGRK